MDMDNASELNVGKKIKIDNVYAREVWNEAIEAAARCVHNEVDADQIRKLKK